MPGPYTPHPAACLASHTRPCGTRHPQPFRGAGAGVLGGALSGLALSTDLPCSCRNCSASFWNTSETWLQAIPQTSASLTGWSCEWKRGYLEPGAELNKFCAI